MRLIIIILIVIIALILVSIINNNINQTKLAKSFPNMSNREKFDLAKNNINNASWIINDKDAWTILIELADEGFFPAASFIQQNLKNYKGKKEKLYDKIINWYYKEYSNGNEYLYGEIIRLCNLYNRKGIALSLDKQKAMSGDEKALERIGIKKEYGDVKSSSIEKFDTSYIDKHFDKAMRFTESNDLDEAALNLRLVLEKILAYFVNRFIPEYIELTNFEQINELHNKGILNDELNEAFHTVRKVSNKGAHSKVDEEPLTQNEVVNAIDLTRNIIDLYKII